MRVGSILLACLALGACSKTSQSSADKLKAFDVAEPAALAADAAAGATPQSPPKQTDSAPAAISVAVPKMAYSYKYGFLLPGPSIGRAQEAHVALCDKLGPARCQVLAMSNDAGDEQVAKGSLKLRVASVIARPFGVSLEKAVSDAGGHAVTQSITAEDVSKDMVDTNARIHQRELLVERLTEILRTRKGTVAELVEAERSVAAAQEELDQAKGWLTELEGRVAMSIIDVDYGATAPSIEHVGGGIGDSVSASASTFLIGLGAILRVLIFLMPWALVGVIGWWGVRRLHPPIRRPVRAEPDAELPPS